jgi:hypothetical protein
MLFALPLMLMSFTSSDENIGNGENVVLSNQSISDGSSAKFTALVRLAIAVTKNALKEATRATPMIEHTLETAIILAPAGTDVAQNDVTNARLLNNLLNNAFVNDKIIKLAKAYY